MEIQIDVALTNSVSPPGGVLLAVGESGWKWGVCEVGGADVSRMVLGQCWLKRKPPSLTHHLGLT